MKTEDIKKGTTVWHNSLNCYVEVLGTLTDHDTLVRRPGPDERPFRTMNDALETHFSVTTA